MGRTYKVGPSGSFGPRYGTVARKRYSTAISALRAPHECPQCHISAVTRLAVGIWFCGRCGYKFTGGAYAPTTKLGQVAERAARSGVAPSLVSELKAAKVEPTVKAPSRRRRKKGEAKKPSEEPKGTEKVPEDKAE